MYASILLGLFHFFISVFSSEMSFVAHHSPKWTPCPNKGLVLSNQGPIPHFDWRECGGVSPVKDQGQCADCWAFSAVANIESQYWRQSVPFILSEQFLLDCNTMGADCGSNGTGVVNTFADIITKLGGVAQEQDYRKYDATKAECQWYGTHPRHELVNVAGLQRVRPRDEEGMAKALVEHGPLSAGINDAMMIIRNRDKLGIDDPTEEQCPPNNRNHAVLIVGFSYALGPDGRWIPYWILKNSWGTSEGDGGYFYLRRGTNACGIAIDVSYATV